jgi:hypothetical protein
LASCGGGSDSGDSAADDGESPTATHGATGDGSDDGDTGDGDGEPSGGETGTEEDLEQAAADMFVAFVEFDDQSYFNFLSRQCRERLGFASVDDHLSGRRYRIDVADIELSSLGVASVEITDFSGSSATVSLVLSGTTEAFEESIPTRWIVEEGGWRRDECANISEPQGGLEGYGTDRDEPIPYGGVADINGWLMTVSYISADDEELVVELGGEPATDGSQLFNVQINPYFNGADASTVLTDDIGFAMVSGSTVYGDEASCAGTDPAFELDIEAAPGDDVGLLFVCREVDSGDADEMLLRMTDLATGTEYWFDLSGS